MTEGAVTAVGEAAVTDKPLVLVPSSGGNSTVGPSDSSAQP
jgi:hypothetical protein